LTTTLYPRTTTKYPWTTTRYPTTTTKYPWTTTRYPTTTTEYPWDTTTHYPTTTTKYPWTITTTPYTTTRSPYPTTTTPYWTTTQPSQRHCPVGWLEVPDQGICFLFMQGVSRSLSWMEAQQMCENLSDEHSNAFLAEVEKDSLHHLLSGVAEFESGFHSVEGWFIGLSDSSNEGSWTWMYSGFPSVYGDLQWWPGYPDYSSNNQKDCALMVKNYDHKFGWVDVPCDQKKFGTPICQTYAR